MESLSQDGSLSYASQSVNQTAIVLLLTTRAHSLDVTCMCGGELLVIGTTSSAYHIPLMNGVVLFLFRIQRQLYLFLEGPTASSAVSAYR